MGQCQCILSCITCKGKIGINWNFGNNIFFLISSDSCHKKMLSLTTPLRSNENIVNFWILFKQNVCNHSTSGLYYPYLQDYVANYMQDLKGLAMIFAGQKNPFIIFRSNETYIYFKTNNKIHINVLK